MQTDVAAHDTDQKQGSAMKSNPDRGGSRKEKQMNAITRTASVAVLVTLGLALAAWAAEPPKPETLPDLDKLAGQPADLAPWAYAWRADRQVQEQPEAYFIPRRLARLDTIYRPDVPRPRGAGWRGTELGIKTRLPAPKGALHSALLWETRVPFTRIELRWPADGRPIPPAEAVEVRIYSGHHWWWGLQADWILASPPVSPDRRTWTYAAEFAASNPAEGRAALNWNRPEQGVLRTDLISVFVDPKTAPDGKAWSVPAMHVFGPLTWKRMDVEIEWGFQPDAAARDYSGRIEGYFGQAGQVAALPDDAGTKVTAGTAWQSSLAGGKRRGVTVPLLYFPGLGSSSTLSSKMTVWSKGGIFTFLPEDVAKGPVLVPEHGVCVLKAGSGKTAGQWAAELAAKNVKSIRERVREHPETTWEEVMQKIVLTRNPPGTVLPPYRQVEDPPTLVQLPEQRWTDAWRKYSLINFKGPFSWWGLGCEVMRPARVMDMTGAHEPSAKNLERWLALPGTKIDGDFADGDGSFEDARSMSNDIDYGFDGSHPGTGGLLGAMAEHYFLTGDREWFKKHTDRMRKAADWIIRQRSLYLQEAPNRKDLWCYGLLPPHVLGDLGWGKSHRRWWYPTDGWYCEGLRRFAEALQEFDPVAARKYLDEAELYRRQLGAALERSIALAPVRPVLNGTYRSHIPTLCYTRGLMNEADQDRNYPQGDIGIGALPAVLSARALDPQDPRVNAQLDILEDALVSRSGPDFYWSCVTAQMGYNYIAPLYLQRDEVENFLRTFMVNFAGYVVPSKGEYYFLEHAHGGKIDVTKERNENNSNSSAFVMECLRNLLVMEIGDSLWLARATPRAWLEQGKKISVKNAPTYFGTVAYEIVSDADSGRITATIEMPSRKAPKEVVLRFRHPKAALVKAVTVNGRDWKQFDAAKETIELKGLIGTLAVTAQY
jgi:hypothetical protein